MKSWLTATSFTHDAPDILCECAQFIPAPLTPRLLQVEELQWLTLRDSWISLGSKGGTWI